MRIANPLYDTAFKYLMENNKLAKKIVSLIIEEDIEELILQNHEHTYVDEQRELRFVRVDFKAVIRQPDGTSKKVLIELQKSKSLAEAIRFRRYLGLNYAMPDVEKDRDGNDAKVAYPIITIYILGYNVEDLPYVSITTGTEVIDSVTKEPLQVNSSFINLLSHRMHVLQVRRLGTERRGRLDHFLNLFSQQWCTSEGYILHIQDISPELRDIAEYLSLPLQDKNFILDLSAEEEIELKFGEKERKLEEALAETMQAKQNEATAKQNEAEAKQNEVAALALADKERAEKEQERTEKEGLISKQSAAVLKLQSKGMAEEDIAETLDISAEKVKEILASVKK